MIVKGRSRVHLRRLKDTTLKARNDTHHLGISISPQLSQTAELARLRARNVVRPSAFPRPGKSIRSKAGMISRALLSPAL